MPAGITNAIVLPPEVQAPKGQEYMRLALFDQYGNPFNLSSGGTPGPKGDKGDKGDPGSSGPGITFKGGVATAADLPGPIYAFPGLPNSAGSVIVTDDTDRVTFATTRNIDVGNTILVEVGIDDPSLIVAGVFDSANNDYIIDADSMAFTWHGSVLVQRAIAKKAMPVGSTIEVVWGDSSSATRLVHVFQCAESTVSIGAKGKQTYPSAQAAVSLVADSPEGDVLDLQNHRPFIAWGALFSPTEVTFTPNAPSNVRTQLGNGAGKPVMVTAFGYSVDGSFSGNVKIEGNWSAPAMWDGAMTVLQSTRVTGGVSKGDAYFVREDNSLQIFDGNDWVSSGSIQV